MPYYPNTTNKNTILSNNVHLKSLDTKFQDTKLLNNSVVAKESIYNLDKQPYYNPISYENKTNNLKNLELKQTNIILGRPEDNIKSESNLYAMKHKLRLMKKGYNIKDGNTNNTYQKDNDVYYDSTSKDYNEKVTNLEKSIKEMEDSLNELNKDKLNNKNQLLIKSENKINNYNKSNDIHSYNYNYSDNKDKSLVEAEDVNNLKTESKYKYTDKYSFLQNDMHVY